MIIKVDLEKAYDRVDWDFLRAILRVVGISDSITTVFMNCISSTSLSVIWNGNYLSPFKPE